MTININTQHQKKHFWNVPWHQQSESNRGARNGRFSPVVKVKAIFGETVIGNVYCWQTQEKRRKTTPTTQKHENNNKKRNQTQLCTLWEACAEATAESATSRNYKQENKVFLQTGQTRVMTTDSLCMYSHPNKDN